MRALMANTKSAEKRAREAIERRGRNVAHRSKVRSAVRKVVVAIQAGNKAEAARRLGVSYATVKNKMDVRDSETVTPVSAAVQK